MNNLLAKIAFFIGLLGTLVAFIFRGKSLKQDAEIAEQEVQAAESQADQLEQQLHTADSLAIQRDALQAQHINERKNDEETIANGSRDHLDNNW